MVIFVLGDLDALHYAKKGLIILAKTESSACQIQGRLVNLYEPAFKLVETCLWIHLDPLRPHVVIEVLVVIFDGLLVLQS